MKCCARLGHIRIEVLWAPSKCWGWRKDCEHNGEHNIKGRLHWVFLAGSCKRQAGWFNRIPFHHTLGPPPSFLSWCWSTGTLWKQTRGSSGPATKKVKDKVYFASYSDFYNCYSRVMLTHTYTMTLLRLIILDGEKAFHLYFIALQSKCVQNMFNQQCCSFVFVLFCMAACRVLWI